MQEGIHIEGNEHRESVELALHERKPKRPVSFHRQLKIKWNRRDARDE